MGRKRKNQSPKKTPKKTDKRTKVLVGPIDSLFKRNTTHLKKENTEGERIAGDIELICLDEENNSKCSRSSTENSRSEKIGVTVKASLCGQTDLDTIVELIDEWISTEDGRS